MLQLHRLQQAAAVRHGEEAGVGDEAARGDIEVGQLLALLADRDQSLVSDLGECMRGTETT